MRWDLGPGYAGSLFFAVEHGIDAETLAAYKRMKSVSRRVNGKDKEREFALASMFVDIATDRERESEVVQKYETE